MLGKVIIFSAPSGAGKSTVVNHLLGLYPQFEFSISATSRSPRGQEQDGVEYYFIDAERFRELIAAVKAGRPVDAFGDHRIAMAAAVMACYASCPITVNGAECVAKSYPGFWDDFDGLERVLG